jgi:hypothetical protein
MVLEREMALYLGTDLVLREKWHLSGVFGMCIWCACGDLFTNWRNKPGKWHKFVGKWHKFKRKWHNKQPKWHNKLENRHNKACKLVD